MSSVLAGEVVEVEPHLSSCTECRDFARGVAAAAKSLDGLPGMGAGLRARTLRAVRRSGERWVVPASVVLAVLNLVMTLLVPAALLATGILGLLPLPLMATALVLSLSAGVSACAALGAAWHFHTRVGTNRLEV